MPQEDEILSDRDEILLRSIEQLAEATSLDAVAQVVRTAARRIARADGATFVLRDGEDCAYVDEDAIGPLWKGQRFPMTACVSGAAMLAGEPILIPDVYDDPRVPRAAYRNTFVKAMAMFPVRVGDPVGAIGVYWAQRYQPSPHDVSALTTLSRAASTALARVELVEALGHSLVAAQEALDAATHARDELRHRVTNAYATAQAIAKLRLPPAQAEAIRGPLDAVARVQDLLDRQLSERSSVDLHELAALELTAFAGGGARFRLDGPAVQMTGDVATALGLVLNELATNSIKYGALGSATGGVDLDWTMEADALRLRWTESGGPPVAPPAHESYGSRLMRRMVETQLKGRLERTYAPSGLRVSIAFRFRKV